MVSLPGGPEPVEVYATVATRNAAFATPRVGQCAITLDDGALSVYYGAMLGWRPPWNAPWGEVAVAEITTPSTTFNSDGTTLTDVMSVNVTPFYGRQYVTEFDGTVLSGTDGDIVTIYIDTSHFELAGCGTSQLHFSSASKRVTIASGAIPDVLRFGKRWTPADKTAHTFIVRGRQLTGTGGTVAANVCQSSLLRVVDIGPATGPVLS